MKINKTKINLVATVSILLGLAAAAPVNAFTIDFLTTFVPFENIPHIGLPVHEEITRDAITNVMPSASLELIVNLQHGVQNSDIIHQFDSESHFDNSSVVLNVGFSGGFLTMTQRFEAARLNALGNPEFLAPHYTNFLQISEELAAALADMATDPACLLQPACPTTRAAADAIVITAFLPTLAINPNPDPHRATNPSSLFHYPPDPNCQGNGLGLCGYFGAIQEAYLGLMSTVDDAVTSALGNHFDPTCLCDRSLEDVMGSSNSHVVRLKQIKNAINAYHAFQDLGHAMHAAQDFFAHSDYVELMAGVAIGQAIPAGTVIALPTTFAQFNLAGLQTVMGTARYNALESGEVRTIWLGDGDYSLGDAGIANFFNPSTGIEIGGIDLFGLSIPSVAISSVGHNANPFPGFNHGHYLSSTALGLNKDTPSLSPTDEPSHRNHLQARQCAVQMSTLLWSAFLQSIGQIAAPVILSCPADMVVNTDPGQCYATGVNPGTPSVSGGCQTPTVTNNAPAHFLKGANVVSWTATDSCSNSATCTQTILVVDREAPLIVCSTNRVAAATASTGARVSFPTPASTDNCPGIMVVCIPPTGSTFPIGTTTVHCTATDASANQATCSFTIHVKGAAEQLQDLTALVLGFHLASGTENSFTSQLKTALADLSAGNVAGAYATLQQFSDHVSAQSGKKLTVPQANALIAAATQIKTVIKGVPAIATKLINQTITQK
ncbi:MAG: hypothetical protein JWR26_2298 [Pedosphaera sp.]|nr:hypothetical protein [Pedosphaera sp.]